MASYLHEHEHEDELYNGFTYWGESGVASALSFKAAYPYPYGPYNPYPPPQSHHDPFFFGFNINIGDQLGLYAGDQDQYEYQYNGFSAETKPLFQPATGEQSWPWEGSELEGGILMGNRKVGRYSVEERRERIIRYLKKKNQRNFNKTIKYVCRKILADRRVRVRGRFARNSTHQPSPISNTHLFSANSHDYLLHMESDQGWLQEPISHFISYPNGDEMTF